LWHIWRGARPPVPMQGGLHCGGRGGTCVTSLWATAG
jgi:hypothetical protein